MVPVSIATLASTSRHSNTDNLNASFCGKNAPFNFTSAKEIFKM